ncbi:MAG: hypothetical protein JWP59_1386 [Massilia sp.]|jgi:hypothetical protein|nr:hypothetical protein [Massilia sp.]
MSTIDQHRTAIPRSLPEKIVDFACFVASTLLMIEMREALDADTGGDKTDAKYRHGL